MLADAVMPRMNGYELCQALKADPQLAEVPVLLLTGTFEPFDEARARAARADGHIAKPFDSQALLTRVRELVEGVTAEPLPLPYPRDSGAAPATALPAAPAPLRAGPVSAPVPLQPAGPPRRTVPPPLPPPGHPLRAGAVRPGTLPPTSVKGARDPAATSAPCRARRAPPPPRPFAPAPARAPARPPPPEPFGMAGPVTADDDWSDVSTGAAAVRPAPPPARRGASPPRPPPAPPRLRPRRTPTGARPRSGLPSRRRRARWWRGSPGRWSRSSPR